MLPAYPHIARRLAQPFSCIRIEQRVVAAPRGNSGFQFSDEPRLQPG